MLIWFLFIARSYSTVLGMLASKRPAATAAAPSSSASLCPPVPAHPSSSFTPTSSHNHKPRIKGKDESMCQVAYEYPSNFVQDFNPDIDASSPVTNGILSKSFLTSSSLKVPKSGLDCVQCVEVFPDSMNHCVPEWDAATGKEMDIIWEQPDLFSWSKGKWDSGHTRRSDLGFVPELDFEELCWEDGQLLVVMQGLNYRGSAKNRSTWHTDETTLTSVLPAPGTFDTPCSADLVDPSSVNVHTQEDEFFSWLQHPPEDLVDRHETTSGVPILGTSLTDAERVYPSDPIPWGSRRNFGQLEDVDNGPVTKFPKSDKLTTFATSMGNRTSHGSNDQHIESVAEDTLVPTATMQNKEPCDCRTPLTAEVKMPAPPQLHSASVSMPCGTSLPNASTSAMNFSNFSRPAVAIKANLQSLGIAKGLSRAERLKQLDKVAVDMYKSQSIDSTTKHLKLIAPRREGAALHAVPRFPQSVGASFIQDTACNLPLDKEIKQNAPDSCLVRRPERDLSTQKVDNQELSATGTLIRSSGVGIESDRWDSSFISSTTLRMDGQNEVLEVPEPSELSSSGGSEDSDGVDGKRASGKLKRKTSNEDSEYQSDALDNEVTGNKQEAAASQNELKRSKAAESHNQSERRRRDRISEKMKALQALVPNSYKTDKASMLEEAIAYIKALKSQIQMMSYRGGTCYSPMILSHGVQHVQMASWPLMNMGIGMNTGIGVNAGLGMYDMNMVTGTAAPRPFSPMMTFPNGLVPPAQTTAAAPDGAPMTRGVAGQAVPLPAHHLLVPVRPGIPISGKSSSTQVVKDASPQSFRTSQQGQPGQIASMGVKGSNLPSYRRGFHRTTPKIGSCNEESCCYNK
ncbi:hypothetical protein GOP47_0002106 [Adiantum capillus-veneris]|uniref:BHLH domain-containing protein n=1 Tax=Adiantum capillus-veneris TaxID=13818 RepID=A0A9D4V9Z4_ADICA|nr:hypothetical protein GOP47_0002106 [Adiantum capillus-veneris]